MRITAKLVELAKKVGIVTELAEFGRILIRFADSADFVISATNARSAISNFAGTFQICRWLRIFIKDHIYAECKYYISGNTSKK